MVSPADRSVTPGVSFFERGPDEKLFRFHIGGRLRKLLAQAMKRAGLKFPRRQGGFHLFCHTYGTWMTRYGGLDTYGLVRCFDGGPCSHIRQCVAAQFKRAVYGLKESIETGLGSPARSFFERRFPGAANLNTYSINEIATKGHGSAHCCQARRPLAKASWQSFCGSPCR